jgi:hypothetical protein
VSKTTKEVGKIGQRRKICKLIKKKIMDYGEIRYEIMP